MYGFSKYIVRTKETCESILKLKIGGSFDYLNEKEKYPCEFPALLIIDEENKHFDYIYRCIFD